MYHYYQLVYGLIVEKYLYIQIVKQKIVVRFRRLAISCMVKSISLLHYCATSTGYCTILEKGSGHTRPGQFEIDHAFQHQSGSLQCRCKYVYSHTWHILRSCYTCGSSLFEYTA